MTCLAPWTSRGVAATDPTAGADFECDAPLVTADDYECYPGACPPPADCEEFVEFVLKLVSDKAADWYGFELRPCLVSRTYSLRCDRAVIAPTLRVDSVRVGKCECPTCPPTWVDVDLCDVIVSSANDQPPWTSIELCRSAAACGDRVEVTGVTGLAWPLPESVRLAVMATTAKVLRAAGSNGTIVANNEDGVLSFQVDDFGFEEFGLMPKSLQHWYGVAV